MDYAIVTFLILLSGLFSGLNLGLMGLDPHELKRKVDLGDKNAAKIYPLRKKGNLLLVTLLLGNVAVNAAISIFLGSLAAGLVAGIVSTALITVFGEIIPQATFSRHALRFSAKAAWLVWMFLYVLYPINKPIALILDKALGDELPTVYSKQELVKILEEHKKSKDSAVEADEERIARGALVFGTKTVQEVMTPRSVVQSVNIDDLLSSSLEKKLQKSGFSRFPVYKGKDEVVGVLYLHDLVGKNYLDKKVSSVARKNVYYVNTDENLDHVLNAFLKTKSHMFLAVNKFEEVIGVVTVEDILEEIIGKEIVDEFDKYADLRKVAAKKRSKYKHV